jgi:Adenylate and Guanylate cyclase catalytic domain/ATP dependent DNA ligase domain
MLCAVCGYEEIAAFRFCPECGVAVATRTSEQRKVVTVLFCDVVGSTALGESTDPEALRALLARYFERMKASAERHGGTLEKFIGDAVMAVFGEPAVHEDDALRACRAAGEMLEVFPELEVEGRIGIATGEVVTGTEERLATGHAVNVAARLQQAAHPGGAPDFPLLCERMLMRRPGIPITYMVFDLLSLDGDDLTRALYSERRSQLEELDLNGVHWQTPNFGRRGGIVRGCLRARARGVVAKRWNSRYRPGERGWLKTKNCEYSRRELERESAERASLSSRKANSAKVHRADMIGNPGRQRQ